MESATVTEVDFEDYTIGILCALPLELAAVQLLLDKTHADLPVDQNDDTQYTLGRVGNHNIVIGCLSAGQLGIGSATAVATRMFAKFRALRFGLMVGIGGGVPSCADVRLGDVVVSQPTDGYGGVIQYDFGKSLPDGFAHTGFLNTPPQPLLQALTNLQARHLRGNNNLTAHLAVFESRPRFRRPNPKSDILFSPDYDHKGDEKTCSECDRSKIVERKPRESNAVTVHYGTIASGNRVIKNARERDSISAKFNGALCFEMEAAGLMNNWPFLVIRGVSDYADSHKNKEWQPHAAAVAAAYAKELLSVVPPADVTRTPIVDDAKILEQLRLTIERVDSDDFLRNLLVVDQAKYRPKIKGTDFSHPMYSWVFSNQDFIHWASENCSQILYLSSPAECDTNGIATHILSQMEKSVLCTDHFVLYFFFSAERSFSSTEFVHTLFCQIINCSPKPKRASLIQKFLNRIREEAFKKWEGWRRRSQGASEQDLSERSRDIPKGKGYADELFAALAVVLVGEVACCQMIVLGGLDNVRRESDFIKELQTFVQQIQRPASKMKILLSSLPSPDIEKLLHGFPCIVKDRERNECLTSLRFDNTRFRKVSKEHKGTCEWLWSHLQYQDWSTSAISRLLLIEGKPGSGKSTLTKYFSQKLQQHEPSSNSSIVAKFFYSYRDGELQRSHLYMVRSILYDILSEDEAFFYHQFQAEYRAQHRNGVAIDWDYTSLKKILRSWANYPSARRLYLIIDAVDESDEDDRRDILNLLFELCSAKFGIVKMFVASRPLGQLELRKTKIQNFIRLQDETKSDISTFAQSFLGDLNLTHLLAQSLEYIVQHAQGVFIWVELTGKELLAYEEEGASEEEIFNFLKRLPTELEDFYRQMSERMKKKSLDLKDRQKMFRFILFARRPLTVEELLHALAVPESAVEFTPSDDHFQKCIPSERRIIYCGGNFLEIMPQRLPGTQLLMPASKGTVQLIHQTVRDFFLDPAGYMANSNFKMSEYDANSCITITCIRYLMLCAANTSLACELPSITTWTSKHFTCYAQYLDSRPLAKYALTYLQHHIQYCKPDSDIRAISAQFVKGLVQSPAIYLLESWLSSQLRVIPLSGVNPSVAKTFRNSLLSAAAWSGFATTVEILLAVGADGNTSDLTGMTPISVAAKSGQTAVLQVLLDRPEIKPDSKDRYHRTPLLWAAQTGHEAAVKILLDQPQVEADSRDEYGQTSLSWAARMGNEASVGLLIERTDVDVNSQDRYGRTPLSWAARMGHEAVTRQLLGQPRVHRDLKDENGQTPLSCAARMGHTTIAKLLLGFPDVEADSKDDYNQTPLSWAARMGHEALVKLLLDNADVDVNLPDRYGRTPLSWVGQKCHNALVEFRADRGAVHEG